VATNFFNNTQYVKISLITLKDSMVCTVETSTVQQYPNVIKFHESKHSEKVVHEQKDKNALEIPTF